MGSSSSKLDKLKAKAEAAVDQFRDGGNNSNRQQQHSSGPKHCATVPNVEYLQI